MADQSPETSERNLHTLDSLDARTPPNSGNNVFIGHDVRGTRSLSDLFSITSPSTQGHEPNAQTSPDSNFYKTLALWNRHNAGDMNQWPERLFTAPPPASANMAQQYMQSISQQDLASNQSPTLRPHRLHQSADFNPPAGSLLPVNLRIWEDMQGNRKPYSETVYKAILKLQVRYGELVITLPGNKPANSLCRICNHPDFHQHAREKDKPQRRWDLSPHILTHASSPIKPWFSSCGRQYSRSHDMRRHEGQCKACKKVEPNPNLASPTESPALVFTQLRHEYQSQSTGNGGLLNRPPTSLNIVPAAAAGTSHNGLFVPNYTDPSVGPNDRFSELESPFSGNMAMNDHHIPVGSQYYPYTDYSDLEFPGQVDSSMGRMPMVQAPVYSQGQQPSGHCFNGECEIPIGGHSSHSVKEKEPWKGTQVSSTEHMHVWCKDPDSWAIAQEEASNSSGWLRLVSLSHRLVFTAVALGLLAASAVFYFLLRLFLYI